MKCHCFHKLGTCDFIYIFALTSLVLLVHVTVHIYTCIYIYVHVHMCIYIYTYLYLYTNICIYRHIHIYICIPIYLYVHTYTYIYIYLRICVWCSWPRYLPWKIGLSCCQLLGTSRDDGSRDGEGTKRWQNQNMTSVARCQSAAQYTTDGMHVYIIQNNMCIDTYVYVYLSLYHKLSGPHFRADKNKDEKGKVPKSGPTIWT